MGVVGWVVVEWGEVGRVGWWVVGGGVGVTGWVVVGWGW